MKVLCIGSIGKKYAWNSRPEHFPDIIGGGGLDNASANG